VTPAAGRALLSGLVDYAGLFPPAALAMDAAVAEYARWRRSPEAFMLGRFVAPSARLEELARAAAPYLPSAGGDAGPLAAEADPAREPWRLSALVGLDTRADAGLIDAFNAAHAGRAVVDSVELKAASPSEAEAALAALPPTLTAFVEVPPAADLPPILATLRARGARAKLRTGGVVPEAIPAPAVVARFIAACASAGVPFKATAGLHHAVRADHALTYEAGSTRAVMHGFLNVFAAATFARGGAGPAELESLLKEEDASAFRLDEHGLAWRRLEASTAELAEARRDFAGSFGSCSFAEPVADLRALGLLGAEAPALARGGSA
jgi:hypothetical protein